MTDPVSRSVHVDADPSTVFDFLTDPANHPRIDGSGSVTSARGAERLTGVGDRFSMNMRIGVPYIIANTVVEYEPDRCLAWRHYAGHRWRYELESQDGGTQVTETFDPSTGRLPMFVYRRLFGYPEAYARSLEKTLARLSDLLE